MDISLDFKKFANSQGITSTTLEDYQSLLNSNIQSKTDFDIISKTLAPDIVNLTPNIVEEKEMNVAIMDVFSRLMKDKIIYLGTGINDQVSNIVTAQLIYLESITGKKEDITMFVNSPGGSVYSGLAIRDTMNFVQNDVSTTVVGMAASMGAILQSSGAKGKRKALPHSRIMIHQPLGGAQGQASDITITANQINILKKELYDILVENTGKTYEEIEADSDRDYWMIAKDAKEYGMIDEVIEKRESKED